MPNWKKVVVSGSDAALNSLTVTDGITGSLSGTASLATTSLSASFASTSSFVNTLNQNLTLVGNQTITGSLTVITGSNVELQVTNTGVRLGSIITDAHTITGSLGVSGSITSTSVVASTIQSTGNLQFGGQLRDANGNQLFVQSAAGVNVDRLLTIGNNQYLQIGFVRNVQITGSASNALLVKGSGATSATNALLVQNSSNTNVFVVGNSGIVSLPDSVVIGGGGYFTIGCDGGAGFAKMVIRQNNNYLGLYGSNAINAIFRFDSSAAMTNTSGANLVFFGIRNGFSPATGSASYSNLSIEPTVSQSAAAIGLSRGLYINPTLTRAQDWRSFEWSNNTGFGIYGSGSATNVILGNTTIGSLTSGSSNFNVVGTTNLSGNTTITGSLNISGSITGSIQGTSSYAINAITASYAETIPTTLNITASNLLVTNDITANNISAISASFGYVETISGSAVVIGQEYIVLNTQSPAARFAGLQIYDSGSFSTSSIVWDSLNNKFIYSNASGSIYNGGGFMSGPRNTGSLGDETFPTLNRVLRGQGGDHLYNSNITDNDTTVSIGINTEITGSLIVSNGITGSLLGTASYATQALSASEASTLEGLNSSQFVQTSGNQGIAGIKTFRDVTEFGKVGSTDGAIKFLENGGIGLSLKAENATGNLLFTDTGDSTVASLTQAGDLTAASFIGSLTGNADTATTASYALTASYVQNAITASYVLNAISSSFATTASYALQALSASWAPSVSSFPFTGSAQITGSLEVTGSTNINGTVKIKPQIGSAGLILENPEATPSVFASSVIYAAGFNQTASGSNNSEFGFFVAGPGSTNTTQGPVFLMRGNLYTRNTNQRGLAAFSSGDISSPVGDDGVLKFTSPASFIDFRTGAGVNDVSKVRIFNNGNVGINTTTDAGFRLDISGSGRFSGNLTITGSATNSLLVRGSGTTDATNVLLIQNSAGTQQLRISGGTTAEFGPGGTNDTTRIWGPTIYTQTIGVFSSAHYLTLSGGGGLFGLVSQGATGLRSSIQTRTLSTMAVSTTDYILSQFGSLPTISPTTGSTQFNAMSIAPVVSQSAAAIGITRGLQIWPVLTRAQDWRSLEWNNDLGFGLYGSGSAPNAIRGNVMVGALITGSSNFNVAGTTRLSGSFNTAISGSILTVLGSGSAQPIFTVQGSQGELFSVTDSLSGSLFSVNDISGLPILEVFSDNTITMGDYQDPMLLTTKKVTQTNSGSFVVYSIPTASYDGAFIEYTIKSGSNARAGQIMSTWAGSSIEFTEVDTMDIGSTTAVGLTMILSGSNAVLTGSSSTGAWTIRTIIRAI